MGVYAVSNLNQLKGVQTKRIESRGSREIETHSAHVQPYFGAFFPKIFHSFPALCCILWIFAALAGIENYPAEGASWSQLSFHKRFLRQILSQGGIPRSGKVVTLVRRQER